MRNREREDRGTDDALTVSHARTLCSGLVLWAVAGAMFFGDGRTVQAQSFEPASECRVSGTTVTCTGDLSGGVDVNGGTGTYTTLVVKGLTGDIAPAARQRIKGIKFTSLSDIDITVDTGDFGITLSDSCIDCAGIGASSEADGAVTVRVRGDITTSGSSGEGIDAGSAGGGEDGSGAVTVEMKGSITTSGDNSVGIYAASEIGDVTVSLRGNITTSGERSGGIYASTDSDDGDIAITLNGKTTITSAMAAGVEFKYGTNNRLTIGAGAVVRISGATYDVLGVSGNETINNYGTLTTPGTIDLGEGTNAFNNMANATFNSGDSVVLGSGAGFTNWGDLSPGGASVVQRTELTGNFVNKEEGTFTVTIDPTGSDLLYVRGTATLNGGAMKVMGAYDGTYTVLRAVENNTVTGTFDDVIDTLFMDYTLNYLDVADDTDVLIDHVELSSQRNNRSFRDLAVTANQRAVAGQGLDSLPNTNKIIQAILVLTTAEQAEAAYTALSGEVHASRKGVLMDTGQQLVAAVNHRLTARAGNPGSRTSTAAVGKLASLADERSGLWMTGYGAWGKTAATSNTAGMDTVLGGVLFGVDRALGEHWRFGVLGGYSQTDVTQRAEDSSGSVETWSAGLYGGAEAGASRLSFGALYNGHDMDAGRTVRFPGFSERLSARYDARSWQLFAEVGHRMPVRDLMLEPFAGVSFINLYTDGFSETGGAAALTASSESNSRTFTTLGVRSAMELEDTVRARVMVGWRHAFGDTDPSSTFTLSNSSAFTVAGAPTAQDAMVAEFGLEASLSDNSVLGVAYQGQYGDGVTAHGFNAGLRVTF